VVISPKPIFLKFGKNDDLNHVTPRAKNGGRPKRGVAWGISEVVRSRAFYFFKVLSMHLQPSTRSVV